MTRTTVFVCEAQPIVLVGVAKVLAESEDLELAGMAASLDEALVRLTALKPRLALVDQSAGLKAVFRFLQDLRHAAQGVWPVLWSHELAEVECFRALQMGARGIARKTLPVEQLIECLRTVAGGQIWLENHAGMGAAPFTERRSSPRLTPREREIVRCLCRGMRNRQIAETLSITPGTVKVHLMHIFEKTGVKDRFELALHGRRLLGVEIEPGGLTEIPIAGAE